MCRYNNKPGNHEYVWSYRNLKQEQVQIRFNLVVAIGIAQIVFLSGIDASETRVRHNNTVCIFLQLLLYLLFATTVCCLCQNESLCEHSYFENVFHLHVHYHSNQTHFHEKSVERELFLKRRQKATWKWLLILQRHCARFIHGISC